MKLQLTILLIIFIVSCSNIISSNDSPNKKLKLKSETWYHLHNNLELKFIEYTYYDNDSIKTVTEKRDDYNYEKKYFYNSADQIEKIIVYNYENSIDTIYHYYLQSNLLSMKITIHTTPNFCYNDTTKFKYNSNNNLIQTISQPGNQDGIYKSQYEYNDDLLISKINYYNDELIRKYEYQYKDRLKIKETISSNGNIQHIYVYEYKKKLVTIINEYLSNLSNLISTIEFKYNKNNYLNYKKVKVPPYSSFVDHEIYYNYYD